MAIFMSNFVSPSNFMIFPLIGSLFFSLVKKVTKVWILLHFASKHQNTFFLTTLLTLASINQQAFFVQILGFYFLLSSEKALVRKKLYFELRRQVVLFVVRSSSRRSKTRETLFVNYVHQYFLTKTLFFLLCK